MELTEDNRRIINLQKQLNIQSDKLAEKDVTISSYETQLKESYNTIKELTTEINEDKKMILEYQNKLSNNPNLISDDIKNIGSSLSDLNPEMYWILLSSREKISRLENEVDSLKNQLSEQSEQEIMNLRVDKQNLTISNETFKKLYEKTVEELKQMTNNFNNQINITHNLEKEIEKCKKYKINI